MVIMANRPLFKLDLQQKKISYRLSLGWLGDEVQENLRDYRIASKILMFLSLLSHGSPPQNKCAAHIWNKILNMKPCMGQISGSFFYMNIEEKVWLFVKKYWLLKTDHAAKTSLLDGIVQFHWNKFKKVTQFTWFGEPWCCMKYWVPYQSLP